MALARCADLSAQRAHAFARACSHDPPAHAHTHTRLPAVDLLLAGSGTYAAAAVQHALGGGFCPLLLRNLDLSSCCLGDRHVGALCAALRCCSMLERLSLAFNALEAGGVKEISVSLLPYVPSLCALDLSHNGCGGWTHESCAPHSCHSLALAGRHGLPLCLPTPPRPAALVRIHVNVCVCVHSLAHSHTHARTHARARTHTHTQHAHTHIPYRRPAHARLAICRHALALATPRQEA